MGVLAAAVDLDAGDICSISLPSGCRTCTPKGEDFHSNPGLVNLFGIEFPDLNIKHSQLQNTLSRGRIKRIADTTIADPQCCSSRVRPRWTPSYFPQPPPLGSASTRPFKPTGCNLALHYRPHCLAPPMDTERRIKV
ncbi:uncharacterized protein [Triticum aestivum]|uniref:uncharacterized protein n=1 Tax=Triticum aestivum TaxID=4565 RepID=UPI001D0109C4|nr:uncharacterized protein LOC123144712 [Triticum aestivum]XP_044419863.1 uncharacterized protein LOC123144712 [Triticum aestivum]XP_044419864.1 uncharacterized protein LOC123144712 [Triticum aestivum]XP_044419865.1 uncharacterized protein LOC123144712 [Triticum aestivum]